MRDRKSSIPLLQDYDGIVDYLESEVRLITDDTITQDSHGQKYVGLWDTGSSRSCIRTDIIEKLGLSFTGRSPFFSVFLRCLNCSNPVASRK